MSYKSLKHVPTEEAIFLNLRIANPRGFHLFIIDSFPLKVRDSTSIIVTRKEKII